MVHPFPIPCDLYTPDENDPFLCIVMFDSELDKWTIEQPI